MFHPNWRSLPCRSNCSLLGFFFFAGHRRCRLASRFLRAIAGENDRASPRPDPRGSGVSRQTGSQAAPAAPRHHHGRQRALGAAPPFAARRRAPHRCENRPGDHRDLLAPAHPLPHALRLFSRKLAPPAGRGGIPDAPSARIPEARTPHHAEEQYPPHVHRALRTSPAIGARRHGRRACGSPPATPACA